MSKFPGVPERIVSRLRAHGYWKRGKPEVRRFSQEHGYRWQYVYEWIRGRVPGPDNLSRLAKDLGVTEAWLLLGGPATQDRSTSARQIATAGGGRMSTRGVSSPRGAPARPHEPAKLPRSERAELETAPSEERPPARVVDLVQPLTRLRELAEHLVEAEHALRESQERFRIMADTAPVMVWMSAPDGTCTFVNKPWLEFTGRTLEQELGGGWSDSIHPDDRERTVETYLAAFPTRGTMTLEYRLRRRDGEYRWFLDTGVPRYETDGAFAGFIGSCVDMTERKRAEEATRALVDVGRRLTETLDRGETARRIAGTALELFKVRRVVVTDLGGAGGRPERLAAAGEGPGHHVSDNPIQLGTGLIGLAIAEGAPVWSADVLADPRLSYTDAARAMVEQQALPAGAAALLISHGRSLGALILRDGAGRTFSPADLELLRALADQAAVGLENASLYAESERRRQEAEALAQVAKTLTETLDVVQVGQRVVDAVLALLDARASAIRLLRPDGSLEAIAGAGAWPLYFQPGHRLPPGCGITGRSVATAEAAWTSDILNEPSITAGEDARRIVDPGGAAVLAVPLRLGGKVIGAIALSRDRGHEFDPNAIRVAQAFADQAALAIHNAELLEEAEQGRREAEVLAEITSAINSSLDLDTVLQRVVDAARQMCGGDGASLALVEPGSNRLAIQSLAGALTRFIAPIEPGRGLGGLVLVTGQPIRTADYALDPRFTKDYMDAVREDGVRATMAVPIRTGTEVEGLLYVTNHSPRPFTDREEEVLVRLAEHAAIAIGNARLLTGARERIRETETLLAVNWALGSTIDPTEAMRRVALETARALGADMVAAYLADADGSFLRPIAGYHVPRTILDRFRRRPLRLRGHPFLEPAWLEHRPAVSENAANDMRIDAELRRHLPAHSLAFLPMVAKGEPIGGLFAVWWTEGRRLKLSELRLAEAIGRHAALALDNARLLRESERRRAVTESLAAVGRLVARSSDPEEVAQQVTDSLRGLLGAAWSNLFHLDPETNRLVCVASSGRPETRVETGVGMPPGTGAVSLAVRGRAPVLTGNALEDPRIHFDHEMRARIEATTFRSVLALPLIVKDRVLGAMAVGDEAGRAFQPEDIRLAQAFADHAAVALDNARLFRDRPRSEPVNES